MGQNHLIPNLSTNIARFFKRPNDVDFSGFVGLEYKAKRYTKIVLLKTGNSTRTKQIKQRLNDNKHHKTRYCDNSSDFNTLIIIA